MWNDFVAELVKVRKQRKNYVVIGGLLLVMLAIIVIISSKGSERFIGGLGLQ